MQIKLSDQCPAGSGDCALKMLQDTVAFIEQFGFSLQIEIAGEYGGRDEFVLADLDALKIIPNIPTRL